jgi:hypothetical protein
MLSIMGNIANLVITVALFVTTLKLRRTRT